MKTDFKFAASSPLRRVANHVLPMLLWLALAAMALGDGKVFSVVQVKVQVPDQRALLHFSNGVERLVIETGFVGQGTNFAWVVPLPARPAIESVSTNFFAKLDACFKPEIIDSVPAYWLALFVVGVILFLTFYLHKKGRSTLATLFLCGLAIFAFMLLAIPNFVKARSADSLNATGNVTVLERKLVGIYDTATISGKDGKSLLDWLYQHKFFVPPSILPVIDDYARQGWVFCAARLDRAATSAQRSQPHPLAFTFAARQPVYPMRLTGVDNERCRLELFVFGPLRAEIPGFKVEHCALSESSTLAANAPDAHRYAMHSLELSRWSAPADVATKLVADLGPRDMQKDAWIAWAPFESRQPVYYSYRAARNLALNWIIGLAIPITVLLGFMRSWLSPKVLRTLILCGWLGAAGAGFLAFYSVEKTEVRYVRGKNACINNLRQIDGAKEQWALEHKKQINDVPTAADLYGPTKYIKVEPVCPDKGTYIIGPMGERPTCSVHGEIP